MECNNCKSSSDATNEFKFYYGVLIGSKSYSVVGGNIFEKEYKVNQESVSGPICEKCIFKYRLKYLYFLLPFTALFVYILLLMFNAIGANNQIYILWIIVGIILLCPVIAFSSLVFKSRKNIGDELLKYSNWNKFREQGYDSFFTRSEYSKLISDNETAEPLESVFNYLAGGILEDVYWNKYKKAEKLFEQFKKGLKVTAD